MTSVRKTRWIAGDVMSWALGVTLGLILGVALLIGVPRLMSKPVAPADTPTASGTTSEKGEQGQGTASSESMNGAAAGEGAAGTGSASTESANAGSASAGGDAPAANAATGDAGGMDMEGAAGTQDSGAQEDSNQGTQAQDTQQEAGSDSAAAPGAAPADAPVNALQGDAGAGETLFAGNCAGCHGANAQGGIGPSLVTADGPKAWTDAQFITTLRVGKTPQRELAPTMPRFSSEQLSDQDIVNILSWVKGQN